MNHAYDRLRELTRLQAELLAAGLLDEAILVGTQWQRHAATLPGQAPAEARPLLEEALALAAANAATIAARAAQVAGELEHIALGRRAIASYAQLA